MCLAKFTDKNESTCVHWYRLACLTIGVVQMILGMMELNRIIRGDCIESLKRIPDNSVDLVFADPPYNLQLKGELYRPNNTKVDGVDDGWDKFGSFREYDDFCAAWLAGCRRVLKETGTIWVIGSYHNIFRLGSVMLDLGFWILNDITWHKTNPMPNFLGKRFTIAAETLLWCSKGEGRKKYTFNHKLMKRYNGGKQMGSVWRIGLCTGAERIKDASGKKAHSTQKPEELLKRVILASTKAGDTVLDPFFGTGTTGAAAKKLRRNFIGIEREEGYIEIAQKRIDGITELWEEADWAEDEKEKRVKVPFVNLVKDSMIKAGDILYTNGSYGAAALVLENGSLKYNDSTGSIHRIGAMIQRTPSCNGWKFWYAVKNDKALLIDDLRNEYIRKYHGVQ
ncbi:MAG: site-specific DNA-methyltransferase [Spirochaetaceae bacterium]|nr:site-specific DNA-methyltransferase [Spirochaetaceae bacterium]